MRNEFEQMKSLTKIKKKNVIRHHSCWKPLLIACSNYSIFSCQLWMCNKEGLDFCRKWRSWSKLTLLPVYDLIPIFSSSFSALNDHYIFRFLPVYMFSINLPYPFNLSFRHCTFIVTTFKVVSLTAFLYLLSDDIWNFRMEIVGNWKCNYSC